MSHENDSADGLPSYNQVVEMDNIASAPLLDERISGNIFGRTLKFEWDSRTYYNPSNYLFFIREPAGCLYAQGKVANDSIVTLTNIDGSEMLKMIKRDFVAPDGISSYGRKVHIYDVLDNNVEIGSVTFSEKELPSNCLAISQKNVDSQITVLSLKLGDFAIFRDHSTRVCSIQTSGFVFNDLKEFGGTLVFQPEVEMSAHEQLLCTAAAIAFKVSMTYVMNSEDGSYGMYLGFLVLFFVVALILLMSL